MGWFREDRRDSGPDRLPLFATVLQFCQPLVDFRGNAQESLVPSELIALQFFFAPLGPFALWLDDIEFMP